MAKDAITIVDKGSNVTVNLPTIGHNATVTINGIAVANFRIFNRPVINCPLVANSETPYLDHIKEIGNDCYEFNLARNVNISEQKIIDYLSNRDNVYIRKQMVETLKDKIKAEFKEKINK